MPITLYRPSVLCSWSSPFLQADVRNLTLELSSTLS